MALTNPVADELQNTSPAAKSAALLAHQALIARAGQPPPLQPTPTPVSAVSTQRPLTAPSAAPAPGAIAMPPADQGSPNAMMGPPPAMPAVKSPTPLVNGLATGTVEGDQARLAQMTREGPGVGQIYSKIAGSRFGQAHPVPGKILGGVAQGLGSALDIAGSMFGPTRMIETSIPGTTMHHALLERELAKNIGMEEKQRTEAAEQQEARARAGLQTAQAQAIPETQRRLAAQEQKMEEYRDAQIQALSDPVAKTDFQAWRKDNPGKPVEDWLKDLADNRPEKLQHVNLAGLGGPTVGNYNPATGVTTDAAGNVIPNPVPYMQPNYASMLPMILPTHTTEMLGPDNVMHRYQYSPETRTFSTDLGPAPTGAAAHQIFQATAVEQLAPQVIADINAHRDKLGNLSSYYNQWLSGTPIADPDSSRLMGELMSLAAMQPALHAFRSTNALDAFEKMMGGLAKNPDATIATIQGLMLVPQTFTNIPQRPAGGGGTNQPKGPQGAPKAGEVVDGYRFKGGNPADPKNWEQVKK